MNGSQAWLTAQEISDVLGVDARAIVEYLKDSADFIDGPGEYERRYSPVEQARCQEEFGIWGNESRAIRRGRGDLS